MKTRILKTTGDDRAGSIRTAVKLLAEGEVVAFPTETVYGLGADAFNRKAIRAIYKVKGRPSDNPLIVHIGSLSQVHPLAATIPIRFWVLAEAFMPGPLTVVLRRSPALPRYLNPGLPSVAVRFPRHPVARALINEAGFPLVAPSANLSGRPSPTRAVHVLEDLDGTIHAILDGGRCRVGLESTVIDLTGRRPTVLRPGVITVEQLEKVLRTKVGLARQTAKKPRSPGLKYRHYSPRAELILLEGKKPEIRKALKEMSGALKGKKKIGVLALAGYTRPSERLDFFSLGTTGVEGAARKLSEGLRELDRRKVDVILCPAFEEEKVGTAVMNRLRKAATRRIRV